MKPLKISYITNARIPTEKAHGVQIFKMCEAFAKAGHSVELVVPKKENKVGTEQFEYYKVDKIFSLKNVATLDLGSKTSLFASTLFFLDSISFLISVFFTRQGSSADIIYTRDYLLPFFISNPSKVVVEIHSIPSHTALFLAALKKAGSVVVITQGLKDVLIQKGIPTEKILVAADAIDMKDFSGTFSTDSSRKKFGLSLDAKIAMYIGLFDAWKGYKVLLDASKELVKSNIKVVMIGGKEEQITKLQNQYPEVTFLGYQKYSELAENQKVADVLVIPNSAKFPISKYFTSPLKLFAHMMSGVPIVASDLPSLREVLQESNAYFAKPDDPESLARTITRAVSNPDISKQKADQALVDVQDYTWDKRAKKITDFLPR